MAKKRMFNKEIIETDDFLDLSTGARCLYFHICMDSDDEGFFNGINKIARISGATKDDINLLLEKKYILCMATNVYVVTHWGDHNKVQQDRFVRSKYNHLIPEVLEKSEGIYKPRFSPKKDKKKQKNSSDTKTETECIQNVTKVCP